jgi:hypothetical protein
MSRHRRPRIRLYFVRVAINQQLTVTRTVAVNGVEHVRRSLAPSLSSFALRARPVPRFLRQLFLLTSSLDLTPSQEIQTLT